MRIVFDPTFDGGAYPDPLQFRDAVAGSLSVGPLGLLGLLETALGLGGPVRSRVERAAELMPRLAEPGFWSASAQKDALATAGRLLEMRDELWLSGWSGEPVSPRLAALARVTSGVSGGSGDRLSRVADALAGEGGFRAAEAVNEVTVLAPHNDLPARWQAVLDGLENLGVARYSQAPAFPEPGPGDLGTAQAILAGDAFADPPHLTGDGTLTLLRPEGVSEAAEATAAWLGAMMASQHPPRSIVIVGRHPLLDEALIRHGLPAAGAPDDTPSPLLSVLPLALALFWVPRDAAKARDLLLVPRGPVSRSLAVNLALALDEWPAVGSPAWRSEVRKAAAEADESGEKWLEEATLAQLFGAESVLTTASQGDSGADRTIRHGAGGLLTFGATGSLLSPPDDRARRGAAPALAEGQPCSRGDVEACLGTLEGWLATISAGNHAPAWVAAYEQVRAQLETFRRLVDATGPASRSAWSAAELSKFAQAATEDALSRVGSLPRQGAQAGVSLVRDPGSVTAPADVVVWWDFTEESEHAQPEPALSGRERHALAELGVVMPDLGNRAVARAERYGRALRMAERAAVLVAPRHSADGEESHPHPLWDEVVEGVAHNSHHLVTRSVPLVPAGVALSRSRRALRPAPRPRRAWNLPNGVTSTREEESPSSYEMLLGCSFRWVLHYVARLRTGLTAPTTSPPLLNGKVAHEAIGIALLQGGGPDQVAARAVRYFDENLAVLNAALAGPGADAERGALRSLIESGARRLAEILQDSGLTVQATEARLVGVGPTGQLAGRVDLLIGPDPAVIDIKSGGARKWRDVLGAGAAVQLAAYGDLLAQQVDAGDGLALDTAPATAYFSLGSRLLLTTDTGRFAHASEVDGLPTAEVWATVAASVGAVWPELEAGSLDASGVPTADRDVIQKATVAGGRLRLPPPCKYCDFGALCGVTYGGLADAGPPASDAHPLATDDPPSTSQAPVQSRFDF